VALYAHTTSSTAAARRLAVDLSKIRRWGDEPVATTSNGDPPPESAFESCAVAAALFVDEVAVPVGGATTAVVVNVPVAFGSSVKPPVDELELDADACAVLDSSPSSASVVELAAVDVASAAVEVSFVVAVTTAGALVFCTSVFVEVCFSLELELVTTVTPGHRL
jgi:hypothetical protein